MRRSILLAALLALVSSCDPDSKPEVAAPSPPPVAKTSSEPARPLGPPQLPRDRTEGYLAAAAAYERGDFAKSEELRLKLPSSFDVELLGARLLAARGDEIAAVRAIESARARLPGQTRVQATAAEIHAAALRFDSAEAEIREGLALSGPTPDLTRARGVLALVRENGARKGLEHLLAAREAEPALEFCAQPLSQAHLLLGNAALAAQDALDAAGHAKAALAAQPDDLDATLLLSDALAAAGEFAQALELRERALERGADVRGALGLLYARAGTAALLAPERPLAVQRFLRARELGLSDEELGFGATVLEEELRAAVDAGVTAYDAGSFAEARAKFTEALRFDRASIEVHNHLGVVNFKLGEFAAAVDEWTQVLDLARKSSLALPEPVHLNLARALHKAGRRDEIRKVLDDYLAREPQGEFAAETREMLARLDAEK